MGTFLLIMLGIFGVLLVLRLLGGLFGRSAGAGYPGQMGGMGMRGPGMGGGPGYYGGAGYGGRGGGFFSGMFGGLGRSARRQLALRSVLRPARRHDLGRHRLASDYVPDQGGDAIVGADDNPVRRYVVGRRAARPTPAAATGAAAAATGAAVVATGVAAAAATGGGGEVAVTIPERRMTHPRPRQLCEPAAHLTDLFRPIARSRRGRGRLALRVDVVDISIQFLDFHVLEPAVAAVVLKTEIAGREEACRSPRCRTCGSIRRAACRARSIRPG